ncbi:MAG: nuclear transport factor 2 family protein [Sheuella sp.]|nr:nuclear transport factor 2 family protein [Sheuella sp.]
MVRMIKLFGLALLISVGANASAQQTEAGVAKAMDTLNAAIKSADPQQLDKIAIPDLTYGHSNGRLENKAQFIDALVQKRSVFKTIDISKQTIHMQGDTAVVRNHVSADTDPGAKGTIVHVEIDVIYVWRFIAGEWKLIARQAYKL